jgi:hypothetical protein
MVVNAPRRDPHELMEFLDDMGERGYRLVGVIPPG